MDNNYYDILQVNKNASPEIIEKAFKTLAKKYHPDLQPEENKKESEEIFKQINEAYEVLSDEEKKKKYDQYLLEKEQAQAQAQAQSQYQESTNYYASQTTEHINNNNYTNTSGLSKEEWLLKQQEELMRKQEIMHQKEIAYQEELQQAREKAYYDAYIQDLKNRGYKIRYKKSLKEHFKNFIAIIIAIFVLFLLFQIPFIKKPLISLYEENVIVRVIVDLIINLFK